MQNEAVLESVSQVSVYSYILFRVNYIRASLC